MGIGRAIEEAVPEGVEDVGVHVAGAFAFEAEDHDAVGAAVAGGEFFGIEELGAVAGLVGVADEVEEPEEFDGAIGGGEGEVGDLSFDFGEGLHGVEPGGGLDEVGSPGGDGVGVVLFEGGAGGFGGEEGEIGVVPVGAVVGVLDGLGVGVAGIVADEVGPDGGLAEVPELAGFGGDFAGEFDGDFFEEELGVGGVGLEEVHDPGAFPGGEVVVGEAGDDFVAAVPPGAGGRGESEEEGEEGCG